MPEKISYVPRMTSANAPAPFEVSASSYYSSTLQPYMAFDKDIATSGTGAWCSNSGVSENSPAWLQIKLDKAIMVGSYGIIPYFWESGKLSYPMSFSLQGSNDGKSWLILDTQTEVGNWENVEKEFPMLVGETYQYYRLHITKAGRNNSGQFSYVYVGELNLYEKQNNKKFLIQGPDNTLYTLNSGVLTPLADQTLNGQNFLNNGLLEPPNGTWIADLPNAKVLYWQDTLSDTVPKVTAALNANPPNQIVLTWEADMNHESILGINSMTADIEGYASITLTFDHNTTWWKFDGSAWVQTTQEAGMTKEVLNAVTAEQWANLLALVNGSLVYRVSFVLDETSVLKRFDVDYINP